MSSPNTNVEDIHSTVHPVLDMSKKMQSDEKSIKLSVNTDADMVQPKTKSTSKTNRPRSNTCPTILSPTKATRLKLGSRVVILGTENVEQRVPHYVGVEATIVDVPGIY